MFRWLKREPKHLIERRQILSKALTDYPLFEPPHRQGPNYLRRHHDQNEDEYTRLLREFAARGEENLQYFMERRMARLASLYAFLNKFEISADLDDAGLANVSAWLPGNACALVGDFRDKAVAQTFFRMHTPWTQGLRGLNVISTWGFFMGRL